MDPYYSLDVSIFCFLCVILTISVVGYWFSLKATNEHFDKCPKLNCDVALVNDRLKNAYSMIAYLEACSREISASIELDKLREQVEPFENLFTTLSQIEDKIRTVENQQKVILRVWNSVKKTNFKFQSKKTVLNDCFQIKSSAECGQQPIKDFMRKMSSKLEEISYNTGLYYYYIEQVQRMMANYEANRKKAIQESSAKASTLMSSLVGAPVKIDLAANFNNPPNPALIHAAKTGDPSELAQLALANSDLMQKAESVNPETITTNSQKMFEENGPNGGSGFAEIGNNFMSKGFVNTKDPEAAEKKYSKAQKDKKIPVKFFQ
jgi:hypothetical protein